MWQDYTYSIQRDKEYYSNKILMRRNILLRIFQSIKNVF